MRIHALLSWFDEQPDMLYDACRSHAEHCDTLIALDGRYAAYPAERNRSSTTEVEAILQAASDTRTPVVVATFDLVAFLVICLALARPMKHAGVALATSAGFWINFILLFILLMKRVPGLLERELWKSAARLSAATVVSGLSTLALVRGVVPYPQASSLVLRTTWLLAAVAAGSLVYLAGARLLGAPEVGEVLGVFRRRRARA